jgi:hypothetical protein
MTGAGSVVDDGFVTALIAPLASEVSKSKASLRMTRAECRWRWKSRRGGRPKIERAIRDLIRRINKENPLSGAPRIHGELLMLGIEVAESTVARYMIRRTTFPRLAEFLRNHVAGIVSPSRRAVSLEPGNFTVR